MIKFKRKDDPSTSLQDKAASSTNSQNVNQDQERPTLREVIEAFVMLLITIIALITITFAWFADSSPSTEVHELNEALLQSA